MQYVSLSRKTIKRIAKSNMQHQWARSILISVVLWLVTFPVYMVISHVIPGWIGWGVYMLAILVAVPLQFGLARFFIGIYRGEPGRISMLFEAYEVGFLRKMGLSIVTGVLIGLWTLLFIVPGIIMGYAYSQAIYIMADNPDIGIWQALKMSKKMTKGYKFDLFVMHLSFLGWMFLSMFTFGILMVVYVAPYMYTTQAGYYVELKTRLGVAEGPAEPVGDVFDV